MVSPIESFKRVLVPVDFEEAAPDTEGAFVCEFQSHRIAFSDATLRAVRLGADLAHASGGMLRLVHATPPMQTSSIYAGPLAVPGQIIREIHDRAKETSEAALDALCSEVLDDPPHEVVIEPASPLALVLEQARKWPASIVVMAASGRNRVARFFVGSTADRVIRQCHCPVLVVPTGT
jgi:nucleotide-binding universal stress UspA family protein